MSLGCPERVCGSQDQFPANHRHRPPRDGRAPSRRASDAGKDSGGGCVGEESGGSAMASEFLGQSQIFFPITLSVNAFRPTF